MIDALTFDADSHTYRVGGQVVPSVTQLLEKLHSFAGVPRDVLAAAAERGTAVHIACEYHDTGGVDEESIDPAIRGYVAAYLRFLGDVRPKWMAVEQRVFHRPLRYAGTLDRAGQIDGRPWIVDLKTGATSHPVWGMQTAAYAQAAGMPTANRGTVQLAADGTYRFREWKDPTDWPAFASLVTLHNWALSHK